MLASGMQPPIIIFCNVVRSVVVVVVVVVVMVVMGLFSLLNFGCRVRVMMRVLPARHGQ